VNLQFRNVSVNRGRVYIEVADGKHIDVTGGLTDPAAAIDLMMAEEKMRQIWERTQRLREFAAECREDAIKGARV
jgi:hypothetical protein